MLRAMTRFEQHRLAPLRDVASSAHSHIDMQDGRAPCELTALGSPATVEWRHYLLSSILILKRCQDMGLGSGLYSLS